MTKKQFEALKPNTTVYVRGYNHPSHRGKVIRTERGIQVIVKLEEGGEYSLSYGQLSLSPRT